MSFSVTVGRRELAGALRTLSKFVKQTKSAEAVLSLSDGELQIELPGGAVIVSADGTWDGEVRAPGPFMVSLARALPQDDPLPIYVDRERLYFAKLSVACTIQPATGSRIELPLDPTLIDVLRVRFRHSGEDVERSGLTPLVHDAEAKVDAMVLQAHNHLFELKVTKEDLWALVRDCICRNS